jgi:hypothetical protein
VLEAQPPAQPHSRVAVERAIRRSDGAYRESSGAEGAGTAVGFEYNMLKLNMKNPTGIPGELGRGGGGVSNLWRRYPFQPPSVSLRDFFLRREVLIFILIEPKSKLAEFCGLRSADQFFGTLETVVIFSRRLASITAVK